MGFEAVGLPQDARVCGLLYSGPARVLISEVEVLSGSFTVGRLYTRKVEDGLYAPVGEPAPDESQHSPVTCPASPRLYFMSTVLETFGGGVGGWITGVHSYDLVSGVRRPLVEYAARQEHDVWVSRLHGVSGDGASVYCSVGFGRATEDGRAIDYVLCALEPATGTLARIAPLPGVFA